MTNRYPHQIQEVRDSSSYVPVPRDLLPVHLPLFFTKAERGPVGVPMWTPDIDTAYRLWGDATFETRSQYHSHAAMFIKQTMHRQGCFVVRLADDAAKTASIVLEAHLTEGVQVTQYEKDADGNFVYDDDGNKVPATDVGGAIIKEPGIRLRYAARPLADDENPKMIETKTVNLNGDQVTIAPIMVSPATSPGQWANNTGFKIYFDAANYDRELVEDTEAMLFTFSPMEQQYGSTTPTAIRSLYQMSEVSFTFRPDTIDEKTGLELSFEDVVSKSYRDEYGRSKLPYNIITYADNVKMIGDKILEVEPTQTLLTNGWMVDILSALDLDGVPFDHVELLTTVEDEYICADEHYVVYLQGGNDGDLSDATYEAKIVDFMNGTLFPEIVDSARYPFTHIYDTGVSLDTKMAMIDGLSLRRDFRLIMSTQDVNNEANDPLEDSATGAVLYAKALLHPDSTLYTTKCSRVSIFQQAGITNVDPLFKKLMPMTFQILEYKSRHYGGQYANGEPKGIPNSLVDLFELPLSWTMYSSQLKNLSWDGGLNYCQYASMTQVHYPDQRTVYPNDTSVLSNEYYADDIIYIKHVAKRVWAIFAGRTDPFEKLAVDYERRLSSELREVFSNKYVFGVKHWQTDEDRKMGFISRTTVEVTGPATFRVDNLDIECKRENYTQGE